MQTYRKCTAQRHQMHPLACKLLLSFPQSRCICALCNAVFASLFVINAVITFYIWADMSCIDEQVHVRTDHAGRISHALQACNQVFIFVYTLTPSSFANYKRVTSYHNPKSSTTTVHECTAHSGHMHIPPSHALRAGPNIGVEKG